MRTTVLVVDDNAENRALAKATLEDEGFAVVFATNGEEGIAAFVRHRPDCVLLDIRMPGIDGVTTCREIRAREGGKDVAIVFVTAQREVDVFDRALAAGGDDFITKPFRPAELVVRVQTALRLRRIAEERNDLAAQIKHQRDDLLRLQLHKEQLVGFLVHDLKNPVSTIELQVQRMLRDPGITARSQSAATAIRDEARSLLRMILNLLDLAKADEDRLAPAPRTTDVGTLIGGVVDELAMKASSSGVSIETEVAAQQIYADPDLMQRVLANLVENGIRYAPEGSALRIRIQPTPEGIELRVADAGPGVPADQRAHVFQRFASGGAKTNRGLGLAFCKVAVEAHGGRNLDRGRRPGGGVLRRPPDAVVAGRPLLVVKLLGGSLEVVRRAALELGDELGIVDRDVDRHGLRVAVHVDVDAGEIERARVHVGAAEHHPGAVTAHRGEQLIRRPRLGREEHRHAVFGRRTARAEALEGRHRDLGVRTRSTGFLVLGLELSRLAAIDPREAPLVADGIPPAIPAPGVDLGLRRVAIGPPRQALRLLVMGAGGGDVLGRAGSARTWLLRGRRSAGREQHEGKELTHDGSAPPTPWPRCASPTRAR